MTRTIFVTVGTTLFDKLIESVSSLEALGWMNRNGYTELIVQYGRGKKPVLDAVILSKKNITAEVYDFKPSLADDMEKSDLVISHAGAGTVSEVLQLRKPRLVVVVNTLLMDNHQLELAHAMKRRGYLFVVDSPEKLSALTVWDEFENFSPRPQDPTEGDSFSRILNGFLGLDSSQT